jgi:hypothetical protein
MAEYGLGWPEIIILLLGVLGGVLPVALTALVVWLIAKRYLSPQAISTTECQHCHQRIPDLGSFCPLCGERRLGLSKG